MPNRDEGLSSLIRGAFLPEEGEVWGSFDLSQQEYRLIVHFAAHLGLRGAGDAVRRYVEDPNTDFHRYVVDITGLDRDSAKATNFAKVYGAGVPKFASMIGRPVDEAGGIYAQYDRELPFVSRLADVCQKTAERRGHVTLVDGARSHFTLWEVTWLEKSEWGRGIAEGWPLGPCSLAEAERRAAGESPRSDRAPPGSRHPWSGCRIRRADSRKAMNRKIQGSGARQLKLGMVGIHDAGHGGRCLLQMHDELCFSLPRGADGRRIGEQIRGIMVDAVRLSIPMRADAEFGRDWGRARKTERLVNGATVIEYGATWDEAEAEIVAGRSAE
jgi:DNA polymerase I-like protein with 3'-5' exonuclease and polymerase domains